MFSSHAGGTYKEKPMFGANPNSEPDSITVGDITTHIRSNLTGQKGAVSAHKKVENKHNAFSISSRGAASSASQSASLEALELADPEDLPELFSSPVPGAALPGLTPEQLSAVKKNLSRAISNPNVVKTYRPGDPRSPEIKMKVQRDLEKKIQQENLAKAKEAQVKLISFSISNFQFTKTPPKTNTIATRGSASAARCTENRRKSATFGKQSPRRTAC
tara:strand:+ start:35 stop:688 length:654 start_codon:yes stop_codon:yes gene_type:complete